MSYDLPAGDGLGVGPVPLVLCSGSRKRRAAEELNGLPGLGRHQTALAICVFSLMGLPPTAGFIGKIYIIASVLSASDGPHDREFLWLAVITVINSAIAAAYYLRIVATYHLRHEKVPATLTPQSGTLPLGVLLCCLCVLTVGPWPQSLPRLAQQSSVGLRTLPAVASAAISDPAGLTEHELTEQRNSK